MVEQPDNLVLQHLRGLRADIAEVKAELKADVADLKADFRSEMNSLRADVASDILSLRKETGEQIASLRKETREQIVGVRRALTEYHSVVVGHGILISDLEERVRRIEQRLDMPAPGAH